MAFAGFKTSYCPFTSDDSSKKFLKNCPLKPCLISSAFSKSFKEPPPGTGIFLSIIFKNFSVTLLLLATTICLYIFSCPTSVLAIFAISVSLKASSPIFENWTIADLVPFIEAGSFAFSCKCTNLFINSAFTLVSAIDIGTVLAISV